MNKFLNTQKLKQDMAKISKSFETKDNNFLEVRADYNEYFDTILSISVVSFNNAKRIYTDLTEIFETVPELVNLVDNINWREIYREDLTEKEIYQ